jgi:hypothetical protein
MAIVTGSSRSFHDRVMRDGAYSIFACATHLRNCVPTRMENIEMRSPRLSHTLSNFLVLTTLTGLLAACAGEPTAPTKATEPKAIQIMIGGLRPPIVPRFDGQAYTGYDLGNVTSNGGTILTTAAIYAIFWGPDWGVNSTFTGDKITTIESFFQGLNGSGFSTIFAQYPGSNGTFSSAPYLGAVYETSSPPSSDPSWPYWGQPICSVIASHGLQLRSDALYMVFAETSPSAALGYHYFANCSGVTIHYGVVLDTDQAPLDQVSDGGVHSDLAATLVDVASHEFVEGVTDPELQTWFTSGGSEIADKCTRSYNGRTQLTNGASFKVQGEWSNQAKNANSGFANGRGELGCVLPTAPPPSVFISGPNLIALHQSAQYTATPQNATGPITYQWRQRVGPDQGSYGPWSTYTSPSSQNSTFFSVNSCGIRSAQMGVLVTDGNGGTFTNAYTINISNPC